jgi:hypothetical protein
MRRLGYTVAIALFTGAAGFAGASCSSSSIPTTGGTDSGARTDTGSGGSDSGAGGGDTGSGAQDSGPCIAPYDAATVAHSTCGHPGDKGNSLGVGSFCIQQTDCTNCDPANGASICTTAGGSMAPTEFFCTLIGCTPDAGDSGCGENAACIAQGGVTACVPDTCLGSIDGG